jgi:glutaredoxin 3
MNFQVYTRTGCPYCTKIKQVLQGKGYSFTEKQLNRDFTREQFYSQFGPGSTFPQVLLDSKRLGGCTETVKYLRENNLV